MVTYTRFIKLLDSYRDKLNAENERIIEENKNLPPEQHKSIDFYYEFMGKDKPEEYKKTENYFLYTRDLMDQINQEYKGCYDYNLKNFLSWLELLPSNEKRTRTPETYERVKTCIIWAKRFLKSDSANLKGCASVFSQMYFKNCYYDDNTGDTKDVNKEYDFYFNAYNADDILDFNLDCASSNVFINPEILHDLVHLGSFMMAIDRVFFKLYKDGQNQ